MAEPVGATALPLDVTDAASVAAFAAQLPAKVHLLVNNAGAAFGVDRIEGARDEDWQRMWETNVLGVLRVTRALLPALRASGDGHVVNLGSIAGFETYAGGAGYTGSKHALRALTRTLRLELLGEPVRVTEVSPGLVETEFSLVRFAGDAERAKSVYRGLEPLTPEDVADCIVWAATRPSHVNIDEIVVRPRDQATATHGPPAGPSLEAPAALLLAVIAAPAARGGLRRKGPFGARALRAPTAPAATATRGAGGTPRAQALPAAWTSSRLPWCGGATARPCGSASPRATAACPASNAGSPRRRSRGWSTSPFSSSQRRTPDMDPQRLKEAYQKLQSLDERMTHKIRPRAGARLVRPSAEQLEQCAARAFPYTVELKEVVQELFLSIASKPSGPAS